MKRQSLHSPLSCRLQPAFGPKGFHTRSKAVKVDWDDGSPKVPFAERLDLRFYPNLSGRATDERVGTSPPGSRVAALCAALDQEVPPSRRNRIASRQVPSIHPPDSWGRVICLRTMCSALHPHRPPVFLLRLRLPSCQPRSLRLLLLAPLNCLEDAVSRRRVGLRARVHRPGERIADLLA